jgi:hypothetical protein
MAETDPAPEMLFEKHQGGGQCGQNNVHIYCCIIVRNIQM